MVKLRRGLMNICLGAGEALAALLRAAIAAAPTATAAGPAPAGYSTWELSLAFWPLEDRPEAMRVRSAVEGMPLETIFTLKDQCEALAKREGKGDAAFGRDKKLPRREYEAGPDDCALVLHPIRCGWLTFCSVGSCG
jgi:hypothetical protein